MKWWLVSGVSGHVIFACSDGVLTAGQSLSKLFVVGKCSKMGSWWGKEFVAIPRVFANCVLSSQPNHFQAKVVWHDFRQYSDQKRSWIRCWILPERKSLRKMKILSIRYLNHVMLVFEFGCWLHFRPGHDGARHWASLVVNVALCHIQTCPNLSYS